MKFTLLSASAAAMLALGAWSATASARPAGLDGLRTAQSLVQQAHYDGDGWRYRRWWWHHRYSDNRGWWWRRHHRFDRDDDRRHAWRDDYRSDRYDRSWR